MTMPDQPGFALFDTAVGRCVVAWRDDGIAAVQLPEDDEATSRRRLPRRLPGAVEGPPPTAVQRAVDRMTALLDGEPDDLRDVQLDLAGVPAFDRQVYEVTRGIGPGSTLSYGEVAERVGLPGSAQAVGQALGRNPFPIVVPCHRVLAADGGMRGFSAPGGVETKRRMLLREGAPGVAPTLF